MNVMNKLKNIFIVMIVLSMLLSNVAVAQAYSNGSDTCGFFCWLKGLFSGKITGGVVGTTCITDANCASNEICADTQLCVPQPPGDQDGDGVSDAFDNCPAVSNSDQTNSDEYIIAEDFNDKADGEYFSANGWSTQPMDQSGALPYFHFWTDAAGADAAHMGRVFIENGRFKTIVKAANGLNYGSSHAAIETFPWRSNVGFVGDFSIQVDWESSSSVLGRRESLELYNAQFTKQFALIFEDYSWRQNNPQGPYGFWHADMVGYTEGGTRIWEEPTDYYSPNGFPNDVTSGSFKIVRRGTHYAGFIKDEYHPEWTLINEFEDSAISPDTPLYVKLVSHIDYENEQLKEDIVSYFDNFKAVALDGGGDACDICPSDTYNDLDGDKICIGSGFVSSEGMIGNNDNCPSYNPDQLDSDFDDIGDACDPENNAEAAASQECGSAGCSLLSVDGNAELIIPPNVVTSEEVFGIAPAESDPNVMLGSNKGRIIGEYNFAPTGAVFDQPGVEVVMRVDTSSLQNSQISRLDMFVFNTATNKWDEQTAECYQLEGTVYECVANVLHFTKYSIIVPADSDGDSILDSWEEITDNCPNVASMDQTDANNNAIGDICEGDRDGDSVVDYVDNCPYVPNEGQFTLPDDSYAGADHSKGILCNDVYLDKMCKVGEAPREGVVGASLFEIADTNIALKPYHVTKSFEVAQSFVPTEDMTISAIELYGLRHNEPSWDRNLAGNVIVTVYNDGAGNPGNIYGKDNPFKNNGYPGTPLHMDGVEYSKSGEDWKSTKQIAAQFKVNVMDAVPYGTPGWFEVPFCNAVDVSAGQRYWIVIQHDKYRAQYLNGGGFYIYANELAGQEHVNGKKDSMLHNNVFARNRPLSQVADYRVSANHVLGYPEPRASRVWSNDDINTGYSAQDLHDYQDLRIKIKGLESCPDVDGDGYYTCGSNSDCNDADSSIHPGATEICDAIDNNCNGEIDEGVKTVFYLDADGDTYGTSKITTLSCKAPENYVSRAGDCDDQDSQVIPGSSCDADSNVCTQDYCDGTNGICTLQSNLNCDDSVACTDDGCDITNGCVNVANDNNCPSDVWVNVGESYWVNVNACDKELRQDQEYRDYSCSKTTDCQYAVTDTKYIVIGTEDNDADNDGVCDSVDRCDDTSGNSVWYAEKSLKPNHYDSSNWDVVDAYGCSCEQVLFCKPGNDAGELKFGCSEGTKKIWEDQSAWSVDCLVNGKVSEGIDKPFFENTDGEGMPDIFTSDNDGDGIKDSEDDMIEDQDPVGDSDHGIPDWHPKSKHKK